MEMLEGDMREKDGFNKTPVIAWQLYSLRQ